MSEKNDSGMVYVNQHSGIPSHIKEILHVSLSEDRDDPLPLSAAEEIDHHVRDRQMRRTRLGKYQLHG